MSHLQYKMSSKVGPLYLEASAEGLHGVWWRKQPGVAMVELKGNDPAVKVLARAAKQIEEYLDGRRRDFDLPLRAEGTDFQKRVWKELAKIPYGTTVSYSDIARKIGNDHAVRAVGTANGRNPLCLVVPCHRVIHAGGGLGGYAKDLQTKSWLLNLERG